MYDNVNYTCINCNKKTTSQTKLLDCSLRNISIGDEFKFRKNCILVLKDSCEHCNSQNAIKIENRIFTKVVSSELADVIEDRWGEYGEIE